jgi:hypothetical protein
MPTVTEEDHRIVATRMRNLPAAMDGRPDFQDPASLPVT